MPKGPFAKINRALKRGKRPNEGVERRSQMTDEELRELREKERMEAARAKRLKKLGIK